MSCSPWRTRISCLALLQPSPPASAASIAIKRATGKCRYTAGSRSAWHWWLHCPPLHEQPLCTGYPALPRLCNSLQLLLWLGHACPRCPYVLLNLVRLLNDVRDACRGLWPRAYWDDWMRLSAVRKGRQCIRPEVCRNFNFGEKGSSGGQFFKRYLSRTRLNQEDIDWPHTDLSYLRPDRCPAPQPPAACLVEGIAVCQPHAVAGPLTSSNIPHAVTALLLGAKLREVMARSSHNSLAAGTQHGILHQHDWSSPCGLCVCQSC